MSEWISVEERLPSPGMPVLAYAPPQSGDYPGDVRIQFDHIDEDSGLWYEHAEHYEHFCLAAKGGGGISWSGPSEESPYTHWMPLPEPPDAV